MQVTIWEAPIGGHSVLLKTLQKTFQAGKLVKVDSLEAIQIEVVPKPPADLLKVPADYTISDMAIDPKRLPEMEKAIRSQFEKK